MIKKTIAGLIVAGLLSTPAMAQWEDNGDGSSTIILHPDNQNVVIVDEGVDYIRFGVWFPSEIAGEPDEYIEFDVEKATDARFDLNTTGATDTDAGTWGWPDGRMNVADVRLFYCLYQSQSDYADVNTSGAVAGDQDYGKMDGVVDSSDLDYYNSWLTNFFGAQEAIALINDAFSGGDPCSNRAYDEPQLAPSEPRVKTSGETEVISGDFPTLIGTWRHILAKDTIVPSISVDLIVNHWAETDPICFGEPGAEHTSEAYSERSVFTVLGSVVEAPNLVYEDRDYDIEQAWCGDPNIGNSSLVTMYRIKIKLGVYLPINQWWAGLGVSRYILTKEKSTHGCSCP